MRWCLSGAVLLHAGNRELSNDVIRKVHAVSGIYYLYSARSCEYIILYYASYALVMQCAC